MNTANGQSSKQKFPLGQVLVTPGAIEALEKAKQMPTEFLNRHHRGDWGDICSDDANLNEEALVDGSRLMSAYRTSTGEKIWIITEAADDTGHRIATTILLPEEY